MQAAFDFAPVPPTPRQRGHRSAARAASHANRVDPGWLERACAAVLAFAQATNGASWLLEDARASALAGGLAEAVEPRAWGMVTRTLQRRGQIEACGYGPAKTSNGSAKVLWRLVTR